MSGILQQFAGIDTPRVLVFGITGKQGRSRTRLMRKYGTSIIAGCTPGKGGQEVDGTPVFDSAAEALEAFPAIDTAVFYVPAHAVAPSALDAMERGIRFMVISADGVPTHDAVRMKEKSIETGSIFLGPNTVGLLDTSGYLCGLIGGSARWAKQHYRPGKVGVISRSGGLSQLLGSFHCRPHLPGPRPDGTYGPLWGDDCPGVSAVVCIGGDPVPGITMLDAASAFERDPRTEIIVAYGETGTTQENDLAEAVARGMIAKPVVVFLGGRFTRAGVSQSHAGAMIRCEEETYAAKRKALEGAGIKVVDRPDAVFAETASILGLSG
jgi:succinyl-CoA synthetase alpha subunit